VNRFCDVRLANTLTRINVRDRARDAPDAVVRACGESEVAHRTFQKSLCRTLKDAVTVEFASTEARVRAITPLTNLHAAARFKHLRTQFRRGRSCARRLKTRERHRADFDVKIDAIEEWSRQTADVLLLCTSLGEARGKSASV
jgi:hypothetical protein